MTSATKVRLDLCEEFDRASYEHGVICTYEFDHHFFEEYCLENLKALHSNPNLTVIVDSRQYRKALSLNPSERPQKANIRYLLHPASVPGVFHAKLFLFADSKRGRLVIGSANCTRAGITANAELCASYAFEEGKREEMLSIFQSAFSFVERLFQQWPEEALASNLSEMRAGAPWLVDSEQATTGPMRLVSNLDEALWPQITAGFRPPVDRVSVVSRFFDAEPTLLDVVDEALRPKHVRVFTQESTTTLTAPWLGHRMFREGRAVVVLGEYADGARTQNLHAKLLAIESESTRRLAFGSANFTSPALLRVAHKGNAEIIAVIDGLSAKQLSDDLFSPGGKGRVVREEGKLRLTPRSAEFEPEEPNYPLRLHEALLKGQSLWVRADVGLDQRRKGLVVRLLLPNEARHEAVLRPETDDRFSAELSDEVLSRLSRASTVAILFVRDTEDTRSNPVLVVNLIDIRSSQPVRKARAVRAAEQSPSLFAQALLDLLRENDEDSLILFLTYCDIPMTNAARPLVIGPHPVNPDFEGGMRSLGKRNLKLFTALHQAALDFVKRHLRKLERHVESGGLEGVPNFLHIALAIGEVLRAQVDRALQGLAAHEDPLDPGLWAKIRKQLDDYYEQYKKLAKCLWEGYIPTMTRLYSALAVREKFEPDLPALRAQFDYMLSIRTKFDALSEKVLRIRTVTGDVVVASYFSSILSDGAWLPFHRCVCKATREGARLLGLNNWPARLR